MCGICGTTNAYDGQALTRMNERMTHRGPDDEGVFLDPGGKVGLGARRLSVIDVAGGHQPLANEDQSVWAVLNGEIYNFGPIRQRLLAAGHVFATRSDTEVLVHLYEERGADLVHDLDGMFAFAIWDSREQQLVLARDRFGEKPLFYAEAAGALVFASELTALRVGLVGSAPLDPNALDSYFVHGYIPSPQSAATGIRQLESGHRLLWDMAASASIIQPYWRPQAIASRGVTDEVDEIEETTRLLDEAVSSRLVADVPVGVFLSGGLDSTLVAAIAARHVGGRLKTFTVDYDVGDVGERNSARKVAAAIGTDHHEFVLTTSEVAARVPDLLAALDQPLADPAFIPLRMLSEHARTAVTVAVGGEGADELFGGYPRYRWLARTARVPRGAASRLVGVASGHASRIPRLGRLARLEDALGPGSTFERHLGWVTDNRAGLRSGLYGPMLYDALRASRINADAPDMDLDGIDVVGSLMRFDQTRWLPDDVLAKADRASMGASLELRTPFLAPALVEFAASIPSATHVRGDGKYLLRKALERILPRLGGGPQKVAFRTPVADWLRGPLAPSLARQLDESMLYREGWFHRATVARWAEEHAAGRIDLSHALWPVFVLGCWCSNYAP